VKLASIVMLRVLSFESLKILTAWCPFIRGVLGYCNLVPNTPLRHSSKGRRPLCFLPYCLHVDLKLNISITAYHVVPEWNSLKQLVSDLHLFLFVQYMIFCIHIYCQVLNSSAFIFPSYHFFIWHDYKQNNS
jgi:hypothetical protein